MANNNEDNQITNKGITVIKSKNGSGVLAISRGRHAVVGSGHYYSEHTLIEKLESLEILSGP